MKLYHGSNVLVQSPDVGHSREKIDFGRGFYVTPILSQAVKWADRFRDGGDSASSVVFQEQPRHQELSFLLRGD